MQVVLELLAMLPEELQKYQRQKTTSQNEEPKSTTQIMKNSRCLFGSAHESLPHISKLPVKNSRINSREVEIQINLITLFLKPLR